MLHGSGARGLAAAVKIGRRAEDKVLSPARKTQRTFERGMFAQRFGKARATGVINPDAHDAAGDLLFEDRPVLVEFIKAAEGGQQIMDQLIIAALKKRLVEMGKDIDLAASEALAELWRDNDPAFGVKLARVPTGEPGRARLRPLKGLVVRRGVHKRSRTLSWSDPVKYGITWDSMGNNGLSRLWAVVGLRLQVVGANKNATKVNAVRVFALGEKVPGGL